MNAGRGKSEGAGYETVIASNGSKWAGEEPDDLDTLLKVLAEEPLDPSFERYGNFIVDLDHQPDTPRFRRRPGWLNFGGNFANVSHVFSIDTNDPEVIEKLALAIRANQQRSDYIAVRMTGPWVIPREVSERERSKS
jgi:hypothetical protein